MGAIAEGFFSRQAGAKRWVLVRRRTDLIEAQASPVLAGIAEVDWEGLYHAYGPANDVPVLLGAVTVGDDPTRAAAWWELWGNIHHQGSVYEATLPAVAPLIALATWKAYPDRVEAVRRAQLWLLSALPAHLHRYHDLIDAVLPADYDELWRVGRRRGVGRGAGGSTRRAGRVARGVRGGWLEPIAADQRTR